MNPTVNSTSGPLDEREPLVSISSDGPTTPSDPVQSVAVSSGPATPGPAESTPRSSPGVSSSGSTPIGPVVAVRDARQNLLSALQLLPDEGKTILSPSPFLVLGF
jgi:hypothetical protein